MTYSFVLVGIDAIDVVEAIGLYGLGWMAR